MDNSDDVIPEQVCLKQVYENRLLPKLDQLEAKRKTTDETVRLIKIIACLVLIPVICIAMFVPEVESMGIFSILGLFIIGGIYSRISSNYRDDYKSEIMSVLVNLSNNEFIYNAKKGIERSIFDKSKIFSDDPRVAEYTSEDLISGNIGNTYLEFSEVVAKISTGTKNNPSYSDLFRGLFFVVKLDKKFHSQTLILNDVDKSSFSWSTGRHSRSHFGSEVKMHNDEFDKSFKVFSTDETEAKTLVTPSFIKRILDLISVKDGFEIQLSFTDNNLYIALPLNTPYLEPILSKSAIDFSMVEHFYERINFTIDVIEALDLNNSSDDIQHVA